MVPFSDAESYMLKPNNVHSEFFWLVFGGPLTWHGIDANGFVLARNLRDARYR